MILKRVSWIMIFLLIITVSLVGCGGGGGGKGGGGKATLEGYVRDYHYNYLSRVKVQVGETVTYTEDNGYFITPKFSLGRYSIKFSKTGYTDVSYYQNFNAAGYWAFNDDVLMNNGIGGGIGNGEISAFDDSLNNSSGEVTIDNSSYDIQALAAVIYNAGDNGGGTTVSLEPTFSSNDNSVQRGFSTVEKPNYRGLRTDPAGKIRVMERKMLEDFKRKGIRSSISKDFKMQATLASSDTFLKEYHGNHKYKFTATKKYDSGKCVIYLDNSRNVNSSYIQQLGDKFNEFYNRLTSYFGMVGNNIDGTEKIYIALTDLDDSVGGYFWSINEFNNVDLEGGEFAGCSNEKEILFVSTVGYSQDPSGWFAWAKTTTAHEFQHLINFTNRMKLKNIGIETWVNEGLSQVAQDIAMTGTITEHDPELEPLVIEFLKNPAYNSLTDWSGGVDVDPNDYPPAYLFIRYFVDRFYAANPDLLKNIIASDIADKSGQVSICTISGMTFKDLYRDWLTAIILDYLNYAQDKSIVNSILYKSWNFGEAKFNNRLGVFPRFEYIYLDNATGGFIFKDDLEKVDTIKITTTNNNVGIRIIKIPRDGVNFSIKPNAPAIKIILKRGI